MAPLGGVRRTILPACAPTRGPLLLPGRLEVHPAVESNLGVRYEPFLWAYVTDDRFLMFKPFEQSSRYPNFPAGVLTAATRGSPERAECRVISIIGLRGWARPIDWTRWGVASFAVLGHLL